MHSGDVVSEKKISVNGKDGNEEDYLILTP